MVKFSISKTNIFRIGLNTRLRVILNDFNFFVKSYYILVGASSTTSAIVITQSIASETALLLEKKGHKMHIFVSPNVTECPPEYVNEVYAKYTELVRNNKN